jgi:putative membrane protein
LIQLIVNWLLSALALWLVARIITGMEIRDFGSAMIAAAIVAVVNFFVGPILRFFGWPLIFLTLGLFTFVINAFLLKLAALIAPGFRIKGFMPALLGSVVLTLITFVLRWMVVHA